MAYNNGFPATYQQMYPQQQFQQNYPQQMFAQQQVMPQQMQQMQQPVQQQYPTVQSGFIRVRNENEARMYPIAPGNSVTFIDEIQPYVYTKTVNMGQLDRPIFEKYRLVKEDDSQTPVEAPQKPVELPTMDLSTFASKDEIAAFKGEIEALKADLESFRGDLYGIAGKKKVTVKKEAVSDD